jgi:hypothetical protein
MSEIQIRIGGMFFHRRMDTVDIARAIHEREHFVERVVNHLMDAEYAKAHSTGAALSTQQ